MFDSAVSYVHHILRSKLQDANIVVDATLGNGLDAAVMAKSIGATGVLYGFDIQPIALDVTNVRLRDIPVKANLHLIGHENMHRHIADDHKGRIDAITFNLGYLPGGDKSVTTQAETTLAALRTASTLLSPGGMISIVCYRHAEGEKELSAIRAELADWPQDSWTCTECSFLNQKNIPPVAFIVTKR